MSWYPWVELPKRSNMTMNEFVNWLHYRAIDFGAPPSFLDLIEALHECTVQDERIEELKNRLEEAEERLHLARTIRKSKKK